MKSLTPEQQLRQKIGCYRCTILNATCHLTCDDYEKSVVKNKTNTFKY